MHYHWDFAFLERYIPLLWRGVLVTLGYTAGTVVLGLIVGLLVGLGRLSKSRLLNLPLIALHRGVPLHAAAGAAHLVLLRTAGCARRAVGQRPGANPGDRGRDIELSLYTGAFYAEIFRGGIISIERGQWDAARALGLRPWALMRRVILPQAVRRMIPPFVNQSITQLKNTSLVSVIAVPDSAVQWRADYRGHLSSAGSLHRGGAGLFRHAVPQHAAGPGL